MAKLRFDLRQFLEYDDPRDVPSYTVKETAHYLQIPLSTLNSWVFGRNYPVKGGRYTKRFEPIIPLSNPRVRLLSFFNICEAHVLGALRKEHNIRLHHIRTALDYVTRKCGWTRPLIEQEFKTDGVALFVDQLGELIIDASSRGQFVMRNIVDAHLKRLVWDKDIVSRLYPFTVSRKSSGPRWVLMDPRYSFGRPILRKHYIATAVIAERYKAGDSIEDLTKDYACAPIAIQEAIRCELPNKIAA